MTPSTPARAQSIHRALRTGLLLAIACAAPLASPAALCAQPTVEQATAAQKQRAREAYTRGKSAFEGGDYATALAAFEEADRHVVSPNARLMMGRSLIALGRRAEAHDVLSAVVRDAATSGARYQETSQAAQEALASIDGQLARVRVELDEPAVQGTLRVGGREIPPARWAESLAAEPGSVEVTLDAQDGRRASTTLQLAAGGSASVRLSLVAPTEPAAQAAPAAPAALDASGQHAPGTDAPQGSSSGMRVASYVLGGVGLAGVATFAVLGSMSASKADELKRECPERSACDPGLRELADDGASLQTGANVALVVGGVALAAGVTLFVLSAEEHDASMVLSPTPGGVQLRGRF